MQSRYLRNRRGSSFYNSSNKSCCKKESYTQTPHTHTHTHTHTRTRTPTRTHTYIHIHTDIHVHTHVHTYTHMYIHVHTYIHIIHIDSISSVYSFIKSPQWHAFHFSYLKAHVYSRRTVKD